MIFADFSGGVPPVTSGVGSLARAGEGNINVDPSRGFIRRGFIRSP
jgi:hypothetical protein